MHLECQEEENNGTSTYRIKDRNRKQYSTSSSNKEYGPNIQRCKYLKAMHPIDIGNKLNTDSLHISALNYVFSVHFGLSL